MRCALVFAAAAGTLAQTACTDDEPVTVVVVTVEARPAVVGLTQIDIDASNDTESIQTSFDVSGASLPVTFSITPTGRTGVLRISATARDADGTVRGLGQGQTTIVPDGRADATVMLDPADFVVNSSIAGNQRLTFFPERNGRQIAGFGDGFSVVFVNDCATLGRCDVFGRSFDGDGLPVTNGITETDDEFIGNLSDDVASIPAIGVGSKGAFIAWETSTDVRGVALDTGGARYQEFAETTLSNSAMFPTDATVASVANGDYVAAWSESGGGAIRGRLVGFDGDARNNPVTGDTADFPIATTPTGSPQRPALTSTGEGAGFACVWRNGTDLRGRFFGSDAMPTTGGEVTLTSFGGGAALVGPHAAATDGGLLVAWGVRDSSSSTLSEGQFQVQRFTAAGSPDGPVRSLSLSTGFFPSAPHLVALDGDLVGATWEGCEAEGDGSGCAIFYQLLRPTGLPIGPAIQVNTTENGDQTGPGIAAVATDRFAVTWTDESEAAPDTSGSSVRARVLYPDLDPVDGRLGARCGQPDTELCGDGLVCMAGSDGVAHCHESCDPEGPAPRCPYGGICTSASGAAGCLF